MTPVLAVAAGGALGAVARYWIGGWVGVWAGGSFPWGTLAVNLIGSLVMGVLVGLFASAWPAGPDLRAFLTVGVLGGFTTFSAFSLDAVLLLERGAWLPALAYILASVLLCLGGLFAGLSAVRGGFT